MTKYRQLEHWPRSGPQGYDYGQDHCVHESLDLTSGKNVLRSRDHAEDPLWWMRQFTPKNPLPVIG